MPRRNVIELIVEARDKASPKLRNVENSVNRISRSLTRLAARTAAALTPIPVVLFADKFRLLENRIRLVTSGTTELAVVTEELIRISLRSRTSFEATANLYARVARSSRELGLSQQELLDFSETVSKSIRVSGSTAAEASAGVIQFGQALASSRLSGDELRSVLEQMPRLAQAIADGLGVGIGQLREFGEEGKLTTDVVLEALRKAAPDIEREFKQLQPLVSEAFTNLRSALQFSLGQIDRYLGITTSLANTVVDLSNQISLLGDAFAGTLEPGEQLSEMTKRLAIFMITTATTVQIFWKSLVDTITFAARQVGESAGALAAATKQLFKGNFSGPSAIFEAFAEQFTADAAETFTDLNKAITLQLVDTIERLAQIMGSGVRIIQDATDLTKSKGGGPILTRFQRDAIKAANEELEQFQNELLNQVQAFNASQISGREYEEELQAIELRLLGAAAGNELLAENLILVMKEFNDAKDAAQKMADELERQQRIMEQFAIQAARNIQSAFADFLFDPFEEGIKGMLKGFIDAIRRMIAEALAFQVLTGLFGGTKFGEFLLGSRAAGGPAFGPTLVGERGPEVINLPRGSRVVSNAALNGLNSAPSFVTNIDARGADPGLIARLPAIMDQRDKQLMLKMKRYLETGAVPI